MKLRIPNPLPKFKAYLFAPRFHLNRFQFNLIGTFFVLLGIILGSYLTLSKLIPQIFALNDTHKIWTFSSATATDYTYDSTLITVDNTGAHPVSTVNLLSNPSFVSNNTSWSVAAAPPSGWIEVPGNATYSTTNFLAMKYEAKCAATSDLTTGLISPTTGVNTYAYNTTACTAANSKAVVSVASGYPIANISQTTSTTACSLVTLNGNAAHLQTNNEWMTMARNAEAQNGNWSNGTVGSGVLFSGHNDNSPATALVATSDDTDGYNGTGNSASSGFGQKRTLTLSNGAVMWDLPGNVWEWTNNQILGQDKPASGNTGAYVEWTAISNYGTLSYDLTRPLDNTYNSTKGVGEYYMGLQTNGTTYGFIRGGSWNGGAVAGAFALV